MEDKNSKEEILRNAAYNVKLNYLDSISDYESIYLCKICKEKYTLLNKLVEDGEFICPKCIIDENIDILKEKGISLEYKSNNKRVYKFINCEHYITLNDDKKINYDEKCPKCELNAIKEEAKAVGLELLLKVDDKNGFYRFDKCDHTQKIAFEDVNNNVVCDTCKSEKRRIDAKKLGLQYIQEINEEYGLYICIKCNLEQKLRFSTIEEKISLNQKTLCGKCDNLDNSI